MTQSTIDHFEECLTHEQVEHTSATVHPSERLPIYPERQWRRPFNIDESAITLDDRPLASRWILSSGKRSTPFHHENDVEGYVIGIALSSTILAFRQSGVVIFDGHAVPGTIQITEPRQSVSAEFRSSCDVLHLFVPRRSVADYYEEARGRPYPGDLLLGDGRLFQDPAVMRLALALSTMRRGDLGFGSLYADGISLAIVVRLLERRFSHALDVKNREPKRLPAWQLRRAIDYIEAHLVEPIRLRDIAASTGLTRMHFASAFRATTGHSPHQYVVRRRLEHAQTLLLRPDNTILDVALSSGFCSHAHFTTVFKRVVGDTPRRWRRHALDGVLPNELGIAEE